MIYYLGHALYLQNVELNHKLRRSPFCLQGGDCFTLTVLHTEGIPLPAGFPVEQCFVGRLERDDYIHCNNVKLAFSSQLHRQCEQFSLQSVITNVDHESCYSMSR